MRADLSAAGLDAYQYSFDSIHAKPLDEARLYALPSCQPGRDYYDISPAKGALLGGAINPAPPVTNTRMIFGSDH